jgi:hypothetical protein
VQYTSAAKGQYVTLCEEMIHQKKNNNKY